MAEYNTVPLGQAGTGNAFILGESQAANRFLSDQARNQAMAYQTALARQQQAQKDAALFAKNQLKLKGGTLWQEDISKLAQQDLNEGVALMQSGINPNAIDWNNPDAVEKAQAFNLRRQDIIAKSEARDLLQKHALKTIDAISKTPELYEPEDIKAFNEWTASPLETALNTPPPPVRERYNVDKDLVDRLDPITFQTSKVVGNQKIQENKMLEAPTKKNIETLINDDEKGRRWIKRETGITSAQAKEIPATFEEAKDNLVKEYKGNPALREQIARQYGITGNSMELDDLLNQQANQMVSAKQKYDSIINKYTEVARGKANEFLKTNPDFTLRDQEMDEERLRMARERMGMSYARFNAFFADRKKDKEVDKLIDGIEEVNPTAINQFNQIMQEVGGKARKIYDEDIIINGKPVRYKNATLVDVPVTVKIPARDSKGKVIPGEFVDEVKNNRYVIKGTGNEIKTMINQILQKTKGYGAQKTTKVVPYTGNEVEDWED